MLTERTSGAICIRQAMAEESTVSTSEQAQTSARFSNGDEASRAIPPEQKEQCDREFDRYEGERPEIRKAEFDTEKSLDTILVTLSSLALTVSLTILKDFIKGDAAVWRWSVAVAWVCFVISLLLSLFDRKLTYQTHRAWRELLDSKFTPWKPGAWDEAQREYDDIPGMKWLNRLKAGSFWSLALGIVLLSMFLLVNLYANTPADTANPQPAVAKSDAPDPPAIHPNANAGQADPAASATAPGQAKVTPRATGSSELTRPPQTQPTAAVAPALATQPKPQTRPALAPQTKPVRPAATLPANQPASAP